MADPDDCIDFCTAAGDLNTAVYGYTSSADVAAAPSSGLVGAVVIAGRGQLQANMLPVGVDLMVPLYWQVGRSPLMAATWQLAGFSGDVFSQATHRAMWCSAVTDLHHDVRVSC